mmetsp:Transcript_6734/g.9778  ORF Transcript_6734/g.9778 Transcript_6734/m.9778 type:complete len:340 (-) Transcript_6734:96-1115(-)
MASQTKRKHSETFNPMVLYDLCTDMDLYGQLPIHRACSFRASLEVVQAIANAYPEGLTVPDNDGWLPLHTACKHRTSLDVLNFLIESCYESFFQKTKKGETPLDILKRKRYAEKRDDNGMIPLHRAFKKGYSGYLIITLVWAYPKGSEIKDNEGRIPFDYITSLQVGQLKELETLWLRGISGIFPSVVPEPTQHQSGNNIDHVLLEADNEAVPSVAQIENEPAQQSKSEDKTEPTQMESSINNIPVVIPAPALQQSESHFAQVLSLADDEFVPPDAQIENESAQQSTSDIKTELTRMKSNFNELKSEIVELKSAVSAFEASVKSDMTEIKSMLRHFGAI